MKRFWTLLLTGSALATFSLGSCAQAPSESQADLAESAEVDSNEAAPIAPEADMASDVSAERSQTSRPQLIKRAYLSLGVTSVEDSFEQVRQIIQQQQGDLLSLEDSGDRQRSLSFEMRVPQERLDLTLDAFTELGEVRSRSISTEDVSSQLVDLQARLKNARKSEAALQELMGRSGEISDVLEVSRELSNVRQTIEQMAAQQQNLQTQVRYSTISLSLESAIASTPDQPAVSRQLANSWRSATHSMGSFTTDLLQIGLWLLVYSPYILILLCGAVIVRRVRLANRG
ncbi:DUF4349 domain-containing protein [cf. Phormidesmis sp. LEGE 11477]|uniref:DUF4349 domain-containing protein n=1 Tax=cf. Phormidesmis sp. LEGE 11477 TaxID=1828680 RepID=UPI00187EDDD6|nr:DUF4349 domain-containing protein [cf. Phormidesmis sp. LEGE 11477]MBE9060809.1 DUF4349 domain-containing protein [cf. Phormidesmis sp. LEGE 11477]